VGEAVQNPGRNGSDGDDDAEIDNKTSSDNGLGKVLQNELSDRVETSELRLGEGMKQRMPRPTGQVKFQSFHKPMPRCRLW
jgi:hypothetical protein